MRRPRYVVRTKPAEAVVPKLKADDPSTLICPTCWGEVVTPFGFNPWTFTIDKTILLPNRTANCPHPDCEALHWVTPAVARRHNKAVYPRNPEVWNQQADEQEWN